MARVIVVASHRRDIERYLRWATGDRHESRLIESPDDLTPERVAPFEPNYIFFPHWSERIPQAIYERWECVLFHMTDLPFGRGGSPLQNLIARGIDHTRLSAIGVTGELDAGPVYLKRPLCLRGGAEEVYCRASDLAFAMIDEIIERRPEPVPQAGEVVKFRRRTPAESAITGPHNLAGLHDFIRMLDADGYPLAFLEHAGFRFEFSRSSLRDDHLLADVRIRRLEGRS